MMGASKPQNFHRAFIHVQQLSNLSAAQNQSLIKYVCQALHALYHESGAAFLALVFTGLDSLGLARLKTRPVKEKRNKVR